MDAWCCAFDVGLSFVSRYHICFRKHSDISLVPTVSVNYGFHFDNTCVLMGRSAGSLMDLLDNVD